MSKALRGFSVKRQVLQQRLQAENVSGNFVFAGSINGNRLCRFVREMVLSPVPKWVQGVGIAQQEGKVAKMFYIYQVKNWVGRGILLNPCGYASIEQAEKVAHAWCRIATQQCFLCAYYVVLMVSPSDTLPIHDLEQAKLYREVSKPEKVRY